MKNTFKVFVTKYFFTDGILEVEVRDCFNVSKDLVAETGSHIIYYHKGEWFYTHEEAKERASLLIQKKIKSLEKQIDKVKKIKI